MTRGCDEGFGVTGMMVTTRVADFGQYATVPKAKLLLARRRRRKFWPERPFSLIFECFLSEGAVLVKPLIIAD